MTEEERLEHVRMLDRASALTEAAERSAGNSHAIETEVQR